jgi:hypothetical protein
MSIPTKPRRIFRLLAACLCTAVASTSVQAAEYRFTPEPAYTPAAAEEIYKPLLEYLSKATGENSCWPRPPTMQATGATS